MRTANIGVLKNQLSAYLKLIPTTHVSSQRES